MTPGARVSAAIEILDIILAGKAAEPALSGWARGNRYAGSKDRAAIRDLVFDGLRNLRSHAARAGTREPNGRDVMIGACYASGRDVRMVFTGQGYAPSPLSDDERIRPSLLPNADEGVRWNIPDALTGDWTEALDAQAQDIASLYEKRAPVTLRVNTRKTTRDTARVNLAAEGIQTEPVSWQSTALMVLGNARGVQNCSAYLDGLVEVQDAASQWAADHVPLGYDARVLDFCAGGGGKSLALAAREDCQIWAHDAKPLRMRDLAPRAKRAGAVIGLLETAKLAQYGPFDTVVVDAPCSGSGTWRRTPDTKWRTSRQALKGYHSMQLDVLSEAESLSQNTIVYMTCSLFNLENSEVIEKFIDNTSSWRLQSQELLLPTPENDGMFVAILTRLPEN